MRADISPQKVEEQGASDKNSNDALKEMTQKEICGISENLRRDNRNGQQPSPITALEPAQSSNREQRAQNEEWNSHGLAERREVLCGFSSHTRSRAEPFHDRVIPASKAIREPNKRNKPTAVMPACDSAASSERIERI